jgi:hypothetical protein
MFIVHRDALFRKTATSTKEPITSLAPGGSLHGGIKYYMDIVVAE